MLSGKEYVRVKRMIDINKRLMGIHMNKSKFEPDVYERLVSELEQELTELKREGEKKNEIRD